MKRWLSVLISLALFSGGLLFWFDYAPPPTIEFIEFRTGQYRIPGETSKADRAAVFRITNRSSVPFSFLAYAPSQPFYDYKLPSPSGWYTQAPRKSGPVGDTIAPHSTLDIEVPALSPSFAIGIHFECGTAEQLQSGNARRGVFHTLRRRIQPDYTGPEPTWSSVAEGR